MFQALWFRVSGSRLLIVGQAAGFRAWASRVATDSTGTADFSNLHKISDPNVSLEPRV